MAGIYIHIPFCKSKCAYCDFYSVALLTKKDLFIDTLLKEVEIQKNYLENEKIETLYFGGGTPSVLAFYEIEKIINQLKKFHTIDQKAEVTLEANPDDLDKDYLKEIHSIGINRLSIGVQSFIDRDLKQMRRRHSAQKAVDIITQAQDIGFNNISADLIYGLPEMGMKEWEYNIDKLLELKIQHISAYHLTIEKNTLFYKWQKSKMLNLPSEVESKEQFEKLINKTTEGGFIHYEISNFGLDGYFSKHNTNYWKNKKYLGLGPSAHSYNQKSRQWNISNVTKYIELVNENNCSYEMENLSVNERFNEYVMTSLRTIWGIDTNKVVNDFGKSYFDYLKKMSDPYIVSDHLELRDDILCLSKKGIFISDYIIRDLIKV